MKELVEKELKMLFGIKEGRKSFKLYEINGHEFVVIEKHYMFNIMNWRKVLKFSRKDQAEDYIIQNTRKFFIISA